jgi:NAD(P)-dependent dehydrogenase (short-subunit alcohol dehydrogenase family)
VTALLDGRVVIVSGVGPGLGRDLVLACAREGASVVLVARDSERLTAIEREVGDPARTHCVAITPDDSGEPARIVAEALDRFGVIDGLVNNAVTIPPLTELADAPASDVAASLEANFYPAFHLTRAVVPTMRTQGRGSVVMINSAVVRHPKRDFGAYNIAKHALLGLTRSLAFELGPAGIRVNTLAPGKIGGARLTAYFDVRAGERGMSAKDIEAEYASNIALRRIPSSAEYADAAIFLLSDLSRSITGHLLDANGGEYFD